MDYQITTQRQRELLRELSQLVSDRVQAETHIESSYRSRETAAKSQYEADHQLATKRHAQRNDELQLDFESSQTRLTDGYDTELNSLSFEHTKTLEQLRRESQATLKKGKDEWTSAKLRATANFDAEKKKPTQQLAEFERELQSRWQTMEMLDQRVAKILKRRRVTVDHPISTPPHVPQNHQTSPIDRLQSAILRAHEALGKLEKNPAVRLIHFSRLASIFFIATIIMAYPSFLLNEKLQLADINDQTIQLAAVLAGATIFGLSLTAFWWVIAFPRVQRQTLNAFPPFAQWRAYAQVSFEHAHKSQRQVTEQQIAECATQRDHCLRAADAIWKELEQKTTAAYNARLKESEIKFRQQTEEARQTREKKNAELREQIPQALKLNDEEFANLSLHLREKLETRLGSSRQVRDHKWNELEKLWREGYLKFHSAVTKMNAFCDQRFPSWESVDWKCWKPTSEVLPALRFGEFIFSLNMLERGIPQEQRLAVEQSNFSLPSVLSYPECPSVLYESAGSGRERAVLSMQNIMMRLLTSTPAGKVRFTVLDPVGLGQNFSAFMHLADYDDRLITNRIWTEAAHINQRLIDLTEHMENVIQKYLRNEFQSIEEYNQFAGEVAEPFQILVIANFPANFTEETARRLVSIASSGARCGVYTLISIDTKMKMPRNFDLADLQQHAATLQWDGSEFAFKDDRMSQLPLKLDPPPTPEQFTELIRTVGSFATDAKRVQVPFATVAAQEGEWWSEDSRNQLSVAFGKAGANNLQHMKLGHGTSQHVLISGKTGSGKSTLMHALVVNFAIHYSPREIHFYLIDFKKGVEFKPYATYQLPHARVIAIESEREFGMSVLERLDHELKQRGDMFRKKGVQDVKGFRDAHPDYPLPRILLIIDEFQELFVQEDKIATDASLLLDRLVRQGRAFGIHVILGSQTLAGAYSLARSTLGQMAVRIALQCSESDAHLILSDDNTAARLLSRPGEAIYNDANGLIEGNHPFQVVWLGDQEREQYLQSICELAKQREIAVDPPVVFEGNVPANPVDNQELRQALSEVNTGTTAPRVWLGSAVSIKAATTLSFHQQTGANLLLVGQQESMALGILSNCLISLEATQPRIQQETKSGLSRFILLDGSRPDSASFGFWKQFAERVPLDIEVLLPAETENVITSIANELNRRLEVSDEMARPIFLTIFNLPRFRSLRKMDEFHSFQFTDDQDMQPKTDKQMAAILKEGPGVGIHTLIWCDNYNNVNRWIERSGLRDIEMRVLFQMNATDSSNLIDSPAASRLGQNRAMAYSESQGQCEKFRPYGEPHEKWITWVRQQLQNRSMNSPLAP